MTYKLNGSQPVRYIATRLREGETLLISELSRDYRHIVTGDLNRIRVHEGVEDPKLWLIGWAINQLGDQLETDGIAVRLREGQQVSDLTWNDRPVHPLLKGESIPVGNASRRGGKGSPAFDPEKQKRKIGRLLPKPSKPKGDPSKKRTCSACGEEKSENEFDWDWDKNSLKWKPRGVCDSCRDGSRHGRLKGTSETDMDHPDKEALCGGCNEWHPWTREYFYNEISHRKTWHWRCKCSTRGAIMKTRERS